MKHLNDASDLVIPGQDLSMLYSGMSMTNLDMPITDPEMTIPDSHISIPGFITQNKHLTRCKKLFLCSSYHY